MLAAQLSSIIMSSLDLELYSNLVFFAEKYLCDNPMSEDIKYYLSKGYIGEGKYHKAYQLLKNTKSQKCRYLFTLICIKLNKFIDAEKALLTDKFYSKGISNKEIENVIPNGAAGYYLLGIVLEKMSRRSEAFIAYKKSVDLDPYMWCSYEKMCKLFPDKVDNNKIYTELNPKILIFNKKFLSMNNNNNGNNNNNNNNSSGGGKQTKDFFLSPDNDNINIESNDSSQANFNQKKQRAREVNENSNSSELNKYRTILDFNSINNNNNNNNNNSSVNMTPVVHKEEIDYQNLNYNNQIPVKNNINNPFVFSSSPNHVQLEFGGISMSGNSGLFNNNNSINPNNINLANNNSSSGFNITNNNITTTNNNNSISDNSTSRINPFNINVSNNSAIVNTFNNNNFNPIGIINLPNPSPMNSSNNNNLDSTPANLFNNIHLNFSNQHESTFSNIKNKRGKQSVVSAFNTQGNNNNNNNFIPGIQLTSINQNVCSPNINNKADQNNNQNNNEGLNIMSKGTSSFQDVGQLLKYYSEIVKKISLYECQAAIDLLTHLPKNHYDCPYTYSSIGKCYFELGKYRECEHFYNLSVQKDPSHLEGMEYLSSCLWHLKDQYQCCNLAHRVLDQSQFSPETWIVLGNCFSLQKEHEIAIKFFTRATQINPSFAYAYTLCGHEYVDNENYVQANKCYKTALSYDERHFNAWWGLGQIQLKEQNYTEAIKYFKKALSINPKSAILHFYLASAYLQNRDINKALNFLLIAEKEDNNNPMIKYQISNIYINKGKHDEALSILLALDEKMPKEAPIHIAIGKIYKMKKDYAQALNHFNIAIDLDPKDSNLAKSLIERLYSESGTENIFPSNK